MLITLTLHDDRQWSAKVISNHILEPAEHKVAAAESNYFSMRVGRLIACDLLRCVSVDIHPRNPLSSTSHLPDFVVTMEVISEPWRRVSSSSSTLRHR